MKTSRWRKLGLVVHVDHAPATWMASHAQVPTVLVLPDRLRVYFATRPRPGLAVPAYVDLQLDRPDRIIAFCDQPLLDLGPPGSFDEHGIMPSSVVEMDGAVYLYYSGWSRLAGRAPYHNTTGLAVSEDGGRTFRRFVDGPVLDRQPGEPFSATSPWVLRQDGSWRAFYSSGLGWLEVDGKMEHVYDIRGASSRDGVHWERWGNPLIPQRSAGDALTRPTLLMEDDDRWSMWFCHRGSRDFRGSGDAYRIGYARSTDLTRWDREDRSAGIDVSEAGWDSQMVAYPCVVKASGETLMFYNGNGFGREGFGLAIRES